MAKSFNTNEHFKFVNTTNGPAVRIKKVTAGAGTLPKSINDLEVGKFTTTTVGGHPIIRIVEVS